MSVSYSISRAGLEIYSTEAVKNPITNTSSDSSGNFVLQTGEITTVACVSELFSDSFESDYTDISSSATVSVPIKYLNYLFKGQRVTLKKGGQTKKPVLEWDDMTSVVEGFITDITFNRDKIELKISGLNILLDQEKKFTFKKTKRSKIIKKIIKASGLKAKVDVTGLVDDVTDFTNISSSGSSSGSSSEASGIGVADIDDQCKKIIGDETNDKKKMEKLHNWGCKKIKYDGYECSNYDCDPSKCLKNLKHLNCGDTSVLMLALYKSAGLNAWIIHGNYHFWVIIEIDGKKYASDCSGNHGHKLNDVWSTSAHPNSPFKGSKVKGYALCS